MKRLLLSASALALFLGGASAQQPAPFDMSGERPPEAAAPPPPQAAPAPAPLEPAPSDVAAPEPQLPVAAEPASPPLAAVDGGETAALAPVPGQSARRFLLPLGKLTLAGEEQGRTWGLYLTEAQAASEAQLNLAYQNAVVVAPEASQLSVRINGEVVATEVIASSEGPKTLRQTLPPGLLKAGWNEVALRATQRHRTDCTIQSTYELWTEIDPAQTYLEFAAPDAARLASFDDIRGIGTDAEGLTRFNLVVPGLGGSGATAPAMRMAEALALLADMPNQSVQVSSRSAPEPGPGVLNVLMGTPEEIASLGGTMPPAGSSAIAMLPDSPLGPSTLLVSGPTWPAIASAVEEFLRPLDRGIETPRTQLASKSWRMPEAPMLFEETRLRFSDLGISTEEFSGRRFRTEFAVGVPADFYAQSYGEATILLDAAYGAAVEPGSRIDIYVNGAIASTVPITSPGGAILRHLPIKVPLRHFRPGANTIALEAVLLTEADRLCAPGATALGDQRFVLFDTSEWEMPPFARIGQMPNLSALSGTAFPYGRSPVPVPLFIDRSDPANFSAAATLVARMSVAAGRPVDLDLAISPAQAADRNALFVGPVANLAPEVLSQVGVSRASRNEWSAEGARTEDTGQTTATFERWRDQLSGSDWRGQVSLFQDWLERTFDISLDSLQFRPKRAAEFMPGGDASLLVAQDLSPSGNAAWTVVTAPSASALADGTAALARQANWSGLGGHITTYSAATERLSQIAVGNFRLAGAQPASLANYRLIAANWLSANVLGYSLALGGFAIALGLATAFLLAALGRRS